MIIARIGICKKRFWPLTVESSDQDLTPSPLTAHYTELTEQTLQCTQTPVWGLQHPPCNHCHDDDDVGVKGQVQG